MLESPPTLTFRRLSETFRGRELFQDKTWRLSPAAFALDSAAVEELRRIGEAAFEFHRAVEQLYQRSVSGRNLLRNRTLKAGWVAEYYDRGKPEELVAFNRSKRLRGRLPPVFRPDLLLTEEGFALTEFDSVPGGIGLTAFLNRLYEEVDTSVIGRDDAMIRGFEDAVIPPGESGLRPLAAIVVSDEAAVYRPELEWLAEQLRERGRRVFCLRPEELIPLGGYTPGMDAKTDRSVQLAPAIERFLRQEVSSGAELAQSIGILQSIVK